MKSTLFRRNLGLVCATAALAVTAITAITVMTMFGSRSAKAKHSGTDHISPADLNRADVFLFIDQAHEDGKINAEQRLLYRLAALRAPELLPHEWQRVATEGRPSPGCYSPILFEAAQKLPTLSEPIRSEVENLMLPPSDLAYSLETTNPYPVIVTYSNQAMQNKAQTVLNSFITSYDRINTDWGWADPPIEAPLNHYRIFLTDTGMGGGAYTSPYDPDTSAWNCAYFTYIVIDDGLDNWSIPGTMAHEWGHACQSAFDTAEGISFMENTTVYLSAKVFQDAWWYAIAAFQYFQSDPYRALEWDSGGYNMYYYGAAMWVFIAEEVFAGDDPVWIREVWEDSAQVGCFNEPDLFDTINTKLAAEGGFQELVKTVAEYRYFVGQDDDRQHYPGAYQWIDDEVAKAFVWTSQQLPITDAAPTTRERPQPGGCNYAVLDITNFSQMPLRYQFSGQSDLLWHVEVFRVRDGQTTAAHRMDIDQQGDGALDIPSQQGDKLVAVICQIGDENYDPDDRDWGGGTYTISVLYAAPAPVVMAIDPDRIARGTQGTLATISGAGFVNSPDTAVTFSGDTKIAAEATSITDTEIEVVLIIGGTAELGPRDVIVTNPGSSPGTGENLLTIIDPSDQPDAGTGDDDDKKGKCNCRVVGLPTAPGLPTALLLLLLFGLTALAIRRR